MPHATSIARSTMTPEMKAALRTYIIRQRQKKKEEEEQDEALRNELKRLEEKKLRDQHSLEEVNKQISQLEKKLTEYKQEKHDLFAQLKKVLHQEDEQRKRLQQIQQQHAKEASEVLARVGPALPPLPLLGNGPGADEQARVAAQNSGQTYQVVSSSPTQYVSPQNVTPASTATSMKRQRSPSPPSSAGVKDPAAYPAYFSSPKRMATPYQRSPYQGSSTGQELRSPPAPAMVSQRLQHSSVPVMAPVTGSMLPGGPVPGHYPSYVPVSGISPGVQNFNGTNPVGMIGTMREQYRPVQDIRSPQAGLTPNAVVNNVQRPHAPPVGLPIIPPHQRMGSITSGFPVRKPSAQPVQFQRQQQYYSPRIIQQHPNQRIV